MNKNADARRRILGYDLARALAFFGMVVVNFKLVMGASDAGPVWLVWAARLLEGRAAATFVVLAGVGVSLLSAKARREGDLQALAGARRRLLSRAAFLFVVGLLYTPIWPPDILHFYGLYLAAAAFLLNASNRRLVGLALGLPWVFFGLLLSADYEREWDWDLLTYEGLWTPEGFIRHLFFNGFHPVLPWLSFLLVGMILGRMDIRDPANRKRVFLFGVAATVIAEGLSFFLVRLLSIGASTVEQAEIVAVFGTGMMPPVPLYMLAGTGVACAVIAASAEAGLRYAEAPWLRPLLATGEMALTLYVAHVVVGMGTLELFGRLENQTLPFALACAALFGVASMLFATLWRRRFSRGPLEILLRKIAG